MTDSSGYSANYDSCSLMDLQTNKILDIQIVQVQYSELQIQGAIKKKRNYTLKTAKSELEKYNDVKASGNLWYALGVHAVCTIGNIKTKVNSELTMSIGLSICQHIANGLLCVRENKKHVGGLVVKLLLRSKRSGVRSPASTLEFQTLVISCFQVTIWLKYRMT